MTRVLLAAALSLVAAAAPALSAPLTYQLPPETAEFKLAHGVDSATAHCLACHSADYVNTQPSKKGKAFWEAEVQKMIKVFHAPIEPADAAKIADYLAATY